MKDNQPPEVRGCSEDIDIKSSEDITFLNWTAPSFYDPAGKPITVTTNYPTNNFNFSWGDFKVQYVALKPSNGLRQECVFNLKIRRKFIHSQNIHAKLPLYCNRFFVCFVMNFLSYMKRCSKTLQNTTKAYQWCTGL